MRNLGWGAGSGNLAQHDQQRRGRTARIAAFMVNRQQLKAVEGLQIGSGGLNIN